MSRGKKTKKKGEPRRRQEAEKKREDKIEDTEHKTLVTPTPSERLGLYFRNEEIIELRNILQKSDLAYNDLGEVPILFAAVTLGKFDVVKKLFKEGVSIDSAGPEHTTPLMWAAKHKNMEMMDLLMRRGANINIENDKGDNVVLIALQAPSWDEDSFIDFWNSVKECDAFDLNHANKSGSTMLHYATKKQWKNVINYLIEEGANVNCVTNRGVTPLMMAASRNHEKVVSALLGANADITFEDERGCTALCYTIAYVMQKHLEFPNPTLDKLMNVIENGKSMTLETYLKRRLDVLLKPPEIVSVNPEKMNSIAANIFHYFVRKSKEGLEVLLEQRVFGRIAEATEAHLEDVDFMHCMLGILHELLHYCTCCYGRGNCPFTEDQIMGMFVSSGGANTCLSILRIHGHVQTNKWLVVAALLPLFFACRSEGKPRAWLQIHYKEILPFHNRFLNMCLVKFNTNSDEYHTSLMKKKVKEFRNLMTKLERGELIVTKHKLKPISGDDHDNTCQKHLPNTQIPTAPADSLDDVSEQELTDLLSLSTCSKKTRRKAAKTLKMKLAKIRNLATSVSTLSTKENEIVKHGSDIKFETVSKKKESFKPQISGAAESLQSPVSNQNTTHYSGNSNEDSSVNNNKILYNEEGPFNTSKYPAKMFDTILNVEVACKNGPFVIEENVSDITDISTNDQLCIYPDRNEENIDGNKDETSASENRSETDIKIERLPAAALGRKIENNVSLSDDSDISICEKKEFHCEENHKEGVQIPLKHSQDKNSEMYEEDILISILKNTEEVAKNKWLNMDVTYLDDHFKSLLEKYIKSWVHEHNDGYPGHCGGGDGLDMLGKDVENLLKLKTLLPDLEKDYIVYLKSVWETCAKKLRDREKQGQFPVIAKQIFEMIQKCDAQLQSKLNEQKEMSGKHTQTESDSDQTTSTESNETLSSTGCVDSGGESDCNTESKNSYSKKMDDVDNSIQQNTLKLLNEVDAENIKSYEQISDNKINESNMLPLKYNSLYDNINNRKGDSDEDHHQKTKTFIQKNKCWRELNDKFSEEEKNKINSAEEHKFVYSDRTKQNINTKESTLPGTSQEKEQNFRSVQNISEKFGYNKIQAKKLSYAELFKDNSTGTNTKEKYMNTNKYGTSTSGKSPLVGNLSTKVNSENSSFVQPPPGFPAHSVVPMETVLSVQRNVHGNASPLHHASPYQLYITLPQVTGKIAPERPMNIPTAGSEAPHAVPAVLPGNSNYLSRWRTYVARLRNVPLTHCRILLDGALILPSRVFEAQFKVTSGGNFGDLYLGLDGNKQPLAIKYIHTNMSNTASTVGLLLQKLVGPMLHLRHKHILNFSHCFQNEARVYLTTSLCEYNLGEYLMCLKLHNKLESRSSDLVKQFLSGLNFLHTLPIPVIHGNLKPSNILVDEHGIIRLADFGLHPILYQIVQPPSSSVIWWSRETHEQYLKNWTIECTTKSDIQVAGMLIHFIVTGGLHPFGAEAQEIINNVMKGTTKVKTTSCNINDLISWMMVFDPKSRPVISDIIRHIYFWDTIRKWHFVLVCCGIDESGEALPVPLSEFHSALDHKATEDNVKGDWVSVVKPTFPKMAPIPPSNADTPTGLLRFIRSCVEDQTLKKPNCTAHNLQNFFLSAFPALPLSLYRLVEETEWRRHPVLANILRK